MNTSKVRDKIASVLSCLFFCRLLLKCNDRMRIQWYVCNFFKSSICSTWILSKVDSVLFLLYCSLPVRNTYRIVKKGIKKIRLRTISTSFLTMVGHWAHIGYEYWVSLWWNRKTHYVLYSHWLLHVSSSECARVIGIRSKMKMDEIELNRRDEWGCFDWQLFRKVRDVYIYHNSDGSFVRSLLLISYGIIDMCGFQP